MSHSINQLVQLVKHQKQWKSQMQKIQLIILNDYLDDDIKIPMFNKKKQFNAYSIVEGNNGSVNIEV